MFPAQSNLKQMETRQRLIICALQLISEGGAEAFSASALIRRAGVSKGALYHHFERLEDVLLAALRFRSEERRVSAERRYQEFTDLAKWLRLYFTEITSFASSPAFLNILLYFNQKGLRSEEVRLYLCQNNNAYFQRMGAIIQHFYPRPIERERLQSLSAMILFTLEGASAHGALQQNHERFQGAWEWLTQAIVRDLAAYE